MVILQADALYFAVLFGAGFVLGTIRTRWITPRVGSRNAELIEAPVMLAITIVAARSVVRHLAVPPLLSARLGMGGFAPVLVLAAEFGLVLWLRRLSLRAYFATRDRVSGTVYYILLGIFALMPLLFLSKP